MRRIIFIHSHSQDKFMKSDYENKVQLSNVGMGALDNEVTSILAEFLIGMLVKMDYRFE